MTSAKKTRLAAGGGWEAGNSGPATRGPSSKVGGRILQAARRLVETGGMEALTIAAVAAGAGVYGSAVHYHFGNKAGLKAALVDHLFDETWAEAEDAAKELPAGRSRIAEVMGRLSAFGGVDIEVAGFETLGTQLRDKEMRARLIALCDQARETFVDALGGGGDAEKAFRLRPLAQALWAFQLGMNLATLIDPSLDEATAQAVMVDMAEAKVKELGV